MAVFKSAIGTISGKIGGLVYRNRNGKTYVSKAPRAGTRSFDPERQKRENKFGMSIKIASAIYGNTTLKQIWANESGKSKGAVHNIIMKEIYSQLDESNPTDIGCILPNFGFELGGQIKFREKELFIETTDFGSSIQIDFAKEKMLQATGIIIMADPGNHNDTPLTVYPINSGIMQVNECKALTFSIQMYATNLVSYLSYQKQGVYLSLVTLDSEGNAVHYSEGIKGLDDRTIKI